jgi:hypothetical protein
VKENMLRKKEVFRTQQLKMIMSDNQSKTARHTKKQENNKLQ